MRNSDYKSLLLTDGFDSRLAHGRAWLSGRNVHANILDGWRAVSGELDLRGGAQIEYGNLAKSVQRFESHSDVKYVYLMPRHRLWAANTSSLAELLAGIKAQSNAEIIFLDTCDQTSSPFLNTAELVDRYLKSNVCSKLDEYFDEGSLGGPFQRWCRDKFGWSEGPISICSSLEPSSPCRVELGWNFGLAGVYRRLARLAKVFAPDISKRTLDLHARFPAFSAADCGRTNYYVGYRTFSRMLVNGLPPSIRSTSEKKISRLEYYREMMNAKLVFSPFGWGEVCFRDYEAAALGCVLIKPCMSHVVTRPDIFEPGKTYLPVRWDLSDLEDVVMRALADQELCEYLSRNLRALYLSYLRG